MHCGDGSSGGTPGRGGRVDLRLRRIERLQTSREFHRLKARGRRFRTDHLRINYMQGPGEYSRLGLVVSRRHGKASQRNRIKRLLREAFRHVKTELPAPLDVVLLPSGPPVSLERYVADLREFARYVSAERRRSRPRRRHGAPERGVSAPPRERRGRTPLEEPRR